MIEKQRKNQLEANVLAMTVLNQNIPLKGNSETQQRLGTEKI